MKKILVIFICTFNHLYSQSLIYDGGFELVPAFTFCSNPNVNNNEVQACLIPTRQSVFSITRVVSQNWYENSSIQAADKGPSMIDRRYLNTYYDGSEIPAHEVGIPYNDFGTQEHRGGANAGIRYVALKNGLLRTDGIAANLTQELAKGRDYRLKFYAVKKGSGNHKIQVQFNTENDWETVTNNVIIQHTVDVTNDGGSNNDSWQEFTFDFSPPVCGVDWIIIRIISGDVVFVDDFSLTDISPADLICNPINGEFNPIIGTEHAGAYPYLFGINNIGNASRANIEIYALNGPLIKQWIVNARYGIIKPIYWNGKNAQGGEVAEGLYEYRLTLRGDPNICSDSLFTGVIQKTNSLFDGTVLPNDYTEVYYDNGLVDIPRPCCDNLFDYYIDNTFLDGPGEINIQIQNNIYLGTIGYVAAQPSADVVLKAGNQIIIGPNFFSITGAQMEFLIDPCASLLRTTGYSSSNEYTGVIINDSRTKEVSQKQSRVDSSITISPNPSTGIFTLQRETDAAAQVIVYDLLGNTILKTSTQSQTSTIDLSNYLKGIYYLQLTEGDKMYSQKIVIQ